MGTAGSYGGSGRGNALLPTWLAGADEPLNASDGDGVAPENADNPDAEAAPPRPAVEPTGFPVDFGNARANFTSFARSGGHDRRALGRATSSFVRAAGGGARAARHMGASRSAGVALAGFLVDAARRGVDEALRTLNLPGLAGRPPAEIYSLRCSTSFARTAARSMRRSRAKPSWK